MKFLAKLLVTVLVNAAGLLIARYFVTGFHLEGTIKEVLLVAAILTALNLVVKPILSLLFGPIILLTLGLGVIIVNTVILYLLDIISPSLTIEGVPALLYASIILSVVNFVLHLAF